MKYDIEFLSYIQPILDNTEFQKRKNYMHHYNLSVYDHCLQVSYKSYLFAKKHHLDKKNTAIGGLLHDFYYNDWQNAPKTRKKLMEKHGFVHAREALENARKIFPDLMNEKVEDIIIRHMFPLNIKPPKYKEAWVVTYMDKYCSMNILKHPKEYPKYLGLRKKTK